MKCIHPLQWPGARGGAGKIRNGMQGARDCHGSRILSAGSGGGVPRRECMQCGGIWGTRLDPQVSLGAGLGGAVLVVSPRGMRRKGPGKTSPSQLFWTKKWPDGPLFTSTPCHKLLAQGHRCALMRKKVRVGSGLVTLFVGLWPQERAGAKGLRKYAIHFFNT